jgi:WD40 repeat protein
VGEHIVNRNISGKLFEKLNSLPPSRRSAILISLPKNLADLSDSERFIELMTNFHFVTSKIALLDLESLIQDYDLVNKKEFAIPEEQHSDLRRIQKTYLLTTDLHSSLPGLDEWLEQSNSQESSKQELLRLAYINTYRNIQVGVASQMWGRLSYSTASNLVKNFLDQAKKTLEVQKTPWLRPLLPTLAGATSSTEQVLTGHSADISAIAITPDGKYLISGDSSGVIILRNLEKNQFIRLEDHKSPEASWYSEATLVLGMRFSDNAIVQIIATSDNKHFISGSWDGTIIFWNIEKQTALHHFVNEEHQYLQQKNFFARIIETSRNLSREEEENYIEEVSKGRWGISNVLHSFTLDESEKRIVSSYFDNAIIVWDIETGSTVYVHNKYSISRKELATNRIFRIPNSDLVILHNSHDFVLVFALDEQSNLSQLSAIKFLDEKYNSVIPIIDSVVSPDGEVIIFSNYTDFYVWSTRSQKVTNTIKNPHNNSLQCLTFTPDSKYLISTSSEKELVIIDICSTEIIARLEEQAIQGMWIVVASPDGKKLLGTLGDSVIKIWNIQSFSSDLAKDILSLNQFQKTTYSLLFTPDSKKLVTGRGEFKIQVRDIEDNCNLLLDIDGNPNSQEFLREFAVSPNGQRIISSSHSSDGNCVSIWDVNSGKLLLKFVAHSSGYYSGEYRTSDINAIAISSNANVIVTASEDFSLKIWKLQKIRLTKTGQIVVKPTLHAQLLGHSDQVKSVAVTPGGKRVVSASSDEVIIVWDIVTGNSIHIIKKQYVDKNYKPHLDVMILSKDGKKAFTSYKFNREIKIWDLETQDVVTLDMKPGNIRCGDGLHLNTNGHTQNITDIGLISNDRYLLTCSYHDSTVMLWDLSKLTEELLLGELRYLPHLLADFAFETKLRRCTVSPDGMVVAVGDNNNKTHLLHIENVEIPQSHYATTLDHISYDPSTVSIEANFISHELYQKCLEESANQRILDTGRLRVFIFLVFSTFALFFCASSQQLEEFATYFRILIEKKIGVLGFLQYTRFLLVLSATLWMSSVATVFLAGKNLVHNSRITWKRFASPIQVILILYFSYYLCPEYATSGSKLFPIIGFIIGGIFGIILAFISAGLLSLLIWVLFIMPLQIIDTRLKKLLSRSKILPSN